jgi:hypothetical protein
MLYTQKLIAQLALKREQFISYQARFGRHLGSFREALAGLGLRYPSAELLMRYQAERLGHDHQPRSAGAFPTSDYDSWRAEQAAAGVPVLRFGQRFTDHEAARGWAECLRGTTTFAVDGSQLLPWRDASIPIALVQAGLFENPHTQAVDTARYTKDVVTELLTPDDLLAAVPDVDARSGEALGYSTQVVHLRRFELEIDTLIARMRRPTGAAHRCRFLRWKPYRVLCPQAAIAVSRPLRRGCSATTCRVTRVPCTSCRLYRYQLRA